MLSTNQNVINFLRQFKTIFSMAFRQMFWSKKTFFMSVISLLPVVLAIILRFIRHSYDATSIFSIFALLIFVLFLSILVSLLYGTSIVADEVDNKTITYLLTRSVSKSSIILGKFTAYLLGAFLLLFLSLLIILLLTATNPKMFVSNLGLFGKYLGIIALALVAYGSIFTFFGAGFKHPVIIGLLFAFGWEKIAVVVPGLIKKISVVYYLLSAFPTDQLPKDISDGLFKSTIQPALSIIILLLVAGAFLGLSVFTIYHKEYKFN